MDTQDIDLSKLPDNVRQEIIDFYNFLISKYTVKKNKDVFLESIKKHTFDLPSDYSFDRELANER